MDKFYTPESTVITCMKHVNEFLEPGDYIIEPSAGGGAFIPHLPSSARLLDISPDHPLIEQADFLKITDFPKGSVFIGNPPFGRQSSLAKKFIKHACKYAKLIAFILPKSFRKASMQSCFDLNFHLVRDVELDDTFEYNEQVFHVPVTFQIWQRKKSPRGVPFKEEPKGWRFVKKNENPTFSFRRVGVYAGKIDSEIESKSTQSHYFIQLDDHSKISRLYDIHWTHDNTVGPRSIGKSELTTVLNQRIH